MNSQFPYEVGFRNGGGIAIAALAVASTYDVSGEFPNTRYLQTAEDAFAYLEKNNTQLCNDGKENIVDDYCAPSWPPQNSSTPPKTKNTNPPPTNAPKTSSPASPPKAIGKITGARRRRRPPLLPRRRRRPSQSSASSTIPKSPPMPKRTAEVAAVRASIQFELATTAEVPNPFGYARQLVQSKDGSRRTTFFFPHDAETAPWWQGENARLASLAAAARLAAKHFPDDKPFHDALQAYAWNQLNWILGQNPFDTCMLHATGRNNIPYMFFTFYEYTNAPGGIINGITGGLTNPHDIDFDLGFRVTGKDEDSALGRTMAPPRRLVPLRRLAARLIRNIDESRILRCIRQLDGIIYPITSAIKSVIRPRIRHHVSTPRDGARCGSCTSSHSSSSSRRSPPPPPSSPPCTSTPNTAPPKWASDSPPLRHRAGRRARVQDHSKQAADLARTMAALANRDLPLNDPDRLSDSLLAVLKPNTGVTWLSFSTPAGDFTGAFRDAQNHLHINLSHITDGKTNLREYTVADDGSRTLQRQDPDSGYDPRTRPFYVAASQSHDIAWSAPTSSTIRASPESAAPSPSMLPPANFVASFPSITTSIASPTSPDTSPSAPTRTSWSSPPTESSSPTLPSALPTAAPAAPTANSSPSTTPQIPPPASSPSNSNPAISPPRFKPDAPESFSISQ